MSARWFALVPAPRWPTPWKFLLLAAFLCAAVPLRSQEVVIFTDHRSIVVLSHRDVGSWTYLKVTGGEMAVMASQIEEIRSEGPEVKISAKAPGAPSRPAEDHAPPPSQVAARIREAPGPPPGEPDASPPVPIRMKTMVSRPASLRGGPNGPRALPAQDQMQSLGPGR